MNPFSIGLASKETFCNRSKDIALLKRNVASVTHTVIYAPRKFGKTSLAHVALDQIDDIVPVFVDLFKVESTYDVTMAIYREIVSVLGRKAADMNSFASRLLKVFKGIRLSMEFKPHTNYPEFSISLGNDPPEVHLETVIQSLDTFCENEGIRVCLVLDEFQEITNLKESKKIEGMLRVGMQAAKRVTFIMLGSRRRILRDMFEDRKRPFYKSAMIYQLPQIPAEEFISFLVEHFKAGGVDLAKEEAADIVAFTNAYPHYTREMARVYFDMKPEGMTLEEVKDVMINMQEGFEEIFAGLTNHQKRLLRAIAELRPENIFSQAFLVAGRLGSQGGVQTSLAKLLKLDVVEQREGRWYVVDPIFEKWLVK